jgi:hypothetical protein
VWKPQKSFCRKKEANKMRYFKVLAWTAMAVGVMATGAQAKAAGFDRDDRFEQRDLRYDHRDVRNDYARVNAMRNHIAADRFRLNEDIRCGRTWAAQADARDLARDQAELNAQTRDIRHDRADMFFDRR